MIEEKQKKSSSFYYIAAILLIVVSVVSVFIFLLHGETTHNNTNGNIDSTSYLVCESDRVEYPFYVDKEAIGTNIKINATFNASGLDTISLVYQVNYNGQDLVKNGLVQMHIAMNDAFGKYSLASDSFGATYSNLEKTAQLGLYAEKREINDVRARFFMLDGINGAYNRDNITKLYNSKGIDCLINN